MGKATDLASEIVATPLTAVESSVRRDADRELVDPVATLDGTIVERPTPQAAPRPVIRAERETWD